MYKNKISHNVISTFFIINILCSILPYNILYANNTGPKSPEASSFEPIDAADMVNLVTGDFSYVLPLLNVPGPEGGYPVSLAYHSGIAMGQEASWAGLGWNINPGALNRSVSGVPDDWKRVNKYSTIYNQGGISTSYSLGVSVGINKGFGVGMYASYTENKTFGGENSYGFDVGVNGSMGLNDNIGLSGSLGSNGASLGIGIGGKKSISGTNTSIGTGGSIGLSVSQSFKNGSTGVSLGASASSTTYESTNINGGVSGSIGVTLNSKNGLFLTSSIGASSLSGGSLNSSPSFKNDAFTIIVPFVDFSYSRSRWWLFETTFTGYNGSLYAGDMNGILDERIFEEKVAFDSYQALYEDNNINDISNTNFSSISYDKYSVSAQGISGTIQPQIFEEGVLYHPQSTLTTYSSGTAKSLAVYYYPENNLNGSFSKAITSNNFYFYFNNENSSYLKVNSNNWNPPSSSGQYPNVFSFNTSGQNLDDTISIDGEIFDGFNENNKRKRSGSFIESYTNGQIISALYDGSNPIKFIEARGLTRNNLPEFGIGGFKITSTDGKTYHYSLPVYQKESFSRSTEKGKNIDNEFLEESQLEPYATHWLLTGITGPDYVDINSNHILDKNDYGYWVEFEYGKWSDGFSWRTPSGNLEYENNIFTKEYHWGIKEIYYLDKIKTKSHTALFIKEERYDNQSSEINIRDGNNPIVYEDDHVQDFLYRDGKYYINGVYDKWEATPNSPITNFFSKSRHKYYFETKKHKSLRLNKIILLKNDSPFVNISKSNSQQSNPILASKLNIKEEYEIWYLNGALYDDFNIDIHDKVWYGEFYNKVLDVGDVIQNTPDIEDDAIRIIDFNHDYKLMPDSPNSFSTSKAKLTLNSVIFRGKTGANLLPPYNFTYHYPFVPYDNINKDDWGYAPNAIAWNLKSITTPTGQVLNIDYEEDVFKEEAAITSFIFDEKVQVKFANTNGIKTLRMRNNSQNQSVENVYFNDYFALGETARVNVQYYLDPDHNGNDRVADIDKFCEVISVNSNVVEFRLPQSNVQNGKRNGGTCHLDDWAYYSWYDSTSSGGVVQEFSNWKSAYNIDNCGEVGNGNSRLKIKVYSNKKITNKIAGGVRVKNLTLTSDQAENYTTSYNYNIPQTNISSGITSYEPSKRKKEVKFITELPGPSVMYEFVEVSKKNIYGEVYARDLYKFNVLKPMTLNNGGFKIGNLLNLTTSQDNTYYNVEINNEASKLKLTKFNLTNNLSALGRLEYRKSYNKENQLISETYNSYKSNIEVNQGLTKETFKTYKKITGAYFNDYYLSSSGIESYPSILKETRTIEGGYSRSISFNKLDFITGDALETSFVDSHGRKFKDQKIPAYHIYYYGNYGNYNMGSKVNNFTSKNMLTQEVVSYKLFESNGAWKPIGVGISTWNNNWSYIKKDGTVETPTEQGHKIWRKHKSYMWDGKIDSKGIFIGYDLETDDSFNWITPNATQPAPWKLSNEITLYDHFSNPLEIRDLNNNYASSKMWDDNSKVFSSSNSQYTEHFSSDAEIIEYFGGLSFIGNGVILDASSTRSDERSHTGEYSNKIGSWGKAFKTTLSSNANRSGKYKISVWANKENFVNARIKIGSDNAVVFNGETVIAGNWVQLNHIASLSEDEQTIYLTSANGNIYYDDYRLYPIESSLSTYVYNRYDELEAVLGSNNLAKKYQYDKMGRLVRVYQEVENTSTSVGGFKRESEYRYNYKRDVEEVSGSGGTGNNQDPPIEGSINVGNLITEYCAGGTNTGWSCVGPQCKRIPLSLSGLNGGSGTYTNYQWQYKLSTSSNYSNINGSPNSPNSEFSYRSDIGAWCDYQGSPVGTLKFRCIVTDSENNQGVITLTGTQGIGCNCWCPDGNCQ